MFKFIKSRLLLPILMIVLSLLLLGGCESTPVSGDSTGDTTVTEDTTSPSTTDSPSLDEWMPLTENGKALYTVVYQTQNLEEGVTATDYAQIARTIASRLNEKLSDTTGRFSTASDRNIPKSGKTITVGMVTGLSDQYYSGMRFQDYRIVEQNGNVALACYAPSALYISSEHFLDAVKLVNGDLYVKRTVLKETYSSYYQIGTMTVESNSVADYSIVYNDASEAVATKLRTLIRNYSGYLLPMVKDTEAAVEKEIVVGVTLRNTADANISGYTVYRQAEKLIITCSTQLEWDEQLMRIEEKFKNVTANGSYDLNSLVQAYSSSSQTRTIMTYNVRNVWSAGGTPGTRDDLTAQMILEYAPDFVCLQEFDTLYRNATGGLVELLSATYTEVPISGVSKADIWNPIFYNHDKYQVVESGFVYFPDFCESLEYDGYTGGTSDGWSKFRSLVWVVLQDKTDESYYVIGNLHYSAERDTHRDEAILVSNKITSLAAKYAGCTTLVTGDYNSARNSSGVNGLGFMLNNDFYDTYDNATRRNDYGTTHEQSTTKLPNTGYMSYAIDHITTLDPDLSVNAYYVIIDEKYLPMSDHCATVMQFSATVQ